MPIAHIIIIIIIEVLSQLCWSQLHVTNRKKKEKKVQNRIIKTAHFCHTEVPVTGAFAVESL